MNPAPPVTSTFMDIVWGRGSEAPREVGASRSRTLYCPRRGRQVERRPPRPGGRRALPVTVPLGRLAAIFAVSAAAALVLTPLVARLAVRFGLLDRPNTRSSH